MMSALNAIMTMVCVAIIVTLMVMGEVTHALLLAIILGLYDCVKSLRRIGRLLGGRFL